MLLHFYNSTSFTPNRLKNSLSYHRLASDRLRRVEHQLAESERNRKLAEDECFVIQRRRTGLDDEKLSSVAESKRCTSSSPSAFIRLIQLSKENVTEELATLSESDLTAMYTDLEVLCIRVREEKDKKIRSRAEALEKSNEEVSQISLCCICRESVRTILFLPCRHLCVCEKCAECPALQGKCPVCRGPIEDQLKVFCS
jgi:hypothetical protein